MPPYTKTIKKLTKRSKHEGRRIGEEDNIKNTAAKEDTSIPNKEATTTSGEKTPHNVSIATLAEQLSRHQEPTTLVKDITSLSNNPTPPKEEASASEETTARRPTMSFANMHGGHILTHRTLIAQFEKLLMEHESRIAAHEKEISEQARQVLDQHQRLIGEHLERMQDHESKVERHKKEAAEAHEKLFDEHRRKLNEHRERMERAGSGLGGALFGQTSEVEAPLVDGEMNGAREA
ncbi:hypothetical protein CC78DRAFT_540087 [Lojkania enalia]|uniref:Uncharacterized protein n=1 Tax=Lojkania enalia TaxID=147567 RepID=A0A9P4TQN6_9PLEO|nr:hypothetical protein CC78DRAFT_540087 [Didymosphaeria enalia]